MRDLSSSNGFRPAQGLSRLTWPQIEIIDAMVSSLCGLTESSRDHEAYLILAVRHGKLRFGSTTELTQEMVPNRT
jgi:hypothetical protein